MLGSKPPTPRATLLVVDDEEDLRTSISHYLASSLKDVDVISAASGAEALSIIRGRRVDAIVTDYRMPGMDGIAFLSAARKLRPIVRGLLATAYPDVWLAEKALNEQRISYFMIKPLDPDRLVRFVADMLWQGARENMVNSLVGMTRELGNPTTAGPTGAPIAP